LGAAGWTLPAYPRVTAPRQSPSSCRADLGPTVPGRPGPDAVGYDVRYVHDVAPGESPELEPLEGQTEIGLGVRARLPFRVFPLAGPGDGSRLVIDVAHRW
jgi:hypothetical protein